MAAKKKPQPQTTGETTANARPAPTVMQFSELTNAQLLAELKCLLNDLHRRLTNYLTMAPDSAAAVDEGIAFVSKADRLLDEARGDYRNSTLHTLITLRKSAVAHIGEEDDDV
jgi:hypothetical protein